MQLKWATVIRVRFEGYLKWFRSNSLRLSFAIWSLSGPGPLWVFSQYIGCSPSDCVGKLIQHSLHKIEEKSPFCSFDLPRKNSSSIFQLSSALFGKCSFNQLIHPYRYSYSSEIRTQTSSSPAESSVRGASEDLLDWLDWSLPFAAWNSFAVTWQAIEFLLKNYSFYLISSKFSIRVKVVQIKLVFRVAFNDVQNIFELWMLNRSH